MDGYRTSRSESISSATSSAPAFIDSPRPDQHASSASVSGAFPPNDDPDGMSEEVRVAIAALGIMKRGGSTSGPGSSSGSPSSVHLPPIDGRPDTSRSASLASNASYQWSQSAVTDSTAASSPVPPGSSAATDSEVGDFDEPARGAATAEGADPRFIERVSQLPLVNGGLEWYGHAKASSRLVKYGAGLVESSFSAVSRPIVNQLGPLDDFACRQLDRLGGAQSSPGEGPSAREQPQDYPLGSRDSSKGRPPAYGEEGYWEQREREREAYEAKDLREEEERRRGQEEERAVAVAGAGAGRSRWQTVLVEAGGLGAAVSEESLKSLRYCLQWLLYATAHLDHQINTLRDFILSLQRHTSSSSQSDALVTASATAHLSQIKHDVVETIRKVVEVVSKYAGVALPEQAKRYVRQSILGLPVKWANAIDGGRDGRGASVGAASDTSTPRAERMEDPYTQSSTSAIDGEQQRSAVLAKTEDAADRVLTFAVESLDMLKSVTSIFGESVQKAEDWIERLRVVGLDRQRQRQASGSMPPPPEDHLSVGTKRRRAIARDSDDGAATGVELGAGEEGVLRRKKGARSEVAQT